MDQESLNQLQSFLNSAQNILILTHKDPTIDSLGASLALYLALEKLGKRVEVACPWQPTVEFGNLVGINKVSSKLGNKNLVISFPYVEDSIGKVSYNIEDGKFNLVIQSQPSHEPLSREKVSYSYSGVSTDLIFVIDTPDLKTLDKFYTQEQNLYSEVPLVNIDSHKDNRQYGKINFLNSRASSTSEIITLLFSQLGLPLDGDMATNLLSGIIFATSNFSSLFTSPEAFEAAALCLKAGGKREKWQVKAKFEEEREGKTLTALPPQESETPPEEPPADWLTPRIYKGSTKV